MGDFVLTTPAAVAFSVAFAFATAAIYAAYVAYDIARHNRKDKK